MTDIERRVLQAIQDAKPGPGGGVRAGDLHPFDFRELDRALQTIKSKGWAEYKAKRDPKTDKVRTRWGWTVTTAGKKALAEPAA